MAERTAVKSIIKRRRLWLCPCGRTYCATLCLCKRCRADARRARWAGVLSVKKGARRG